MPDFVKKIAQKVAQGACSIALPSGSDEY